MPSNLGKLKAGNLQGSFDLQLIPLVIAYSAGVPSIVKNPSNEEITLTDVGAGVVTLTLATAAIAPLMVPSIVVIPTDATTLGLIANVNGVPTTSAVTIVVNSGADGATETDPVQLHLLIVKQVLA